MNPAVIAALPIILDLIAKGVPAVVKLIEWIQAIRTVAQQSQAWTPEQEELFIKALIATATDPAYQLDQKA